MGISKAGWIRIRMMGRLRSVDACKHFSPKLNGSRPSHSCKKRQWVPFNSVPLGNQSSTPLSRTRNYFTTQCRAVKNSTAIARTRDLSRLPHLPINLQSSVVLERIKISIDSQLSLRCKCWNWRKPCQCEPQGIRRVSYSQVFKKSKPAWLSYQLGLKTLLISPGERPHNKCYRGSCKPWMASLTSLGTNRRVVIDGSQIRNIWQTS